jgi:cell division protein FtsI (penicillin-binding protein 3)
MKKDKNTRMTGGMLVLYLLLTLVMGTAIIVGIVKTQTEEVGGKEWRERAARRESRVNQVEPARRGDILSSDGKVLSTTVVECKLYLDLGKKYEKGRDGKEKFAGAVSDSLLFSSLDTMAQMVSESVGKHSKDYYVDLVKKERAKEHPSQCFRVEQEKIPYSVWLAITRLPGWRNCVVKEVDRRSVRYEVRSHIYNEMASNTVGLENGEGTGEFTGLEGAYDSILKGRDGVYNSRRLTKGIWLADAPNEGATTEQRTDGDSVQKVVLRKRIDGQDIVATIDTRIQDVAEDALRQSLETFGGKAGCVIVMEVETGYVVACANLAREVDKAGNTRYREMRDWNSAISSRYEPGSTMKSVVMTAMLNDPKIKIDTTMKVPVVKRIFPGSQKVIEDSHPNGDSLSVRKVIEKSSNVGMAELGWKYYRDRRSDLVALMKQVFPYEKLNLDVKAQEPNYLLNDVNNSTDDFLRLTYGYSTAVTPMQIITFYNALAGGGRMVKPLFCRAIIDNKGRRHEIAPVVMREQAFSKESAKIMTEMLEGVVDHGTAHGVIKDNNYHIAGKTGTASAHGMGSGVNNASFAGFFPANHPRYTCYVMLENMSTRTFGTQAAKVFKMISDCVMAIDERLSEDLFADADVDSTKLLQRPVLLRGNQKGIAKAYRIIGCTYSTMAPNSKWVVYRGTTQDSPSTYMAETPKEGRVPNCYGMSAKDAVELLHSLGLKVRVVGYGKVLSQTPQAGTSVKKGAMVEVNLK